MFGFGIDFLVMVFGVHAVAGEGADPVGRLTQAPARGTETSCYANRQIYPEAEHSVVSDKELAPWQSARALGELFGVPRRRTGIGLKLTGGRTAQAWALRHRHLRAALTPLVRSGWSPPRSASMATTTDHRSDYPIADCGRIRAGAAALVGAGLSWAHARHTVAVAPIADGEPATTSLVYHPQLLLLTLVLATTALCWRWSGRPGCAA